MSWSRRSSPCAGICSASLRISKQLRVALDDTAARADLGDRASSQLKLMLKLNQEQEAVVASLPALLDEDRVLRHVRHAIATAEMRSDPLPPERQAMWRSKSEVKEGSRL